MLKWRNTGGLVSTATVKGLGLVEVAYLTPSKWSIRVFDDPTVTIAPSLEEGKRLAVRLVCSLLERAIKEVVS
jgi:hypothetical protein